MNLQVTPAEWAAIEAAGSGVLFREGEWLDDLADVLAEQRNTRPPAEFVEAAQTCDHEGHQYLTNMNFGSGAVTACNLCKSIDGKRRVAVVVPCDCYEPQPHCQDGLVTVGHVVVTWGPLAVVGNDDNCDDEHDHVVVCDGPSVGQDYPAGWLCGPNGGPNIDEHLPPDTDTATLVGQYAIGVEVVA